MLVSIAMPPSQGVYPTIASLVYASAIVLAAHSQHIEYDDYPAIRAIQGDQKKINKIIF